MRITTKIRNAVNREMCPLGRTYYDAIPLSVAFDILKRHGLVPVQEDGTEWQGLLCGEDSSTTFDLSYDGEPVVNAVLAFQWHKMPSGKWEINCYLS